MSSITVSGSADRIGGGLLVGSVDLGGDGGVDLGQGGLVGDAFGDQPVPEAWHRIVGDLRGELILVHVLVLVAQHVAERPERHALEQHRPVAAAGVLDGLAWRPGTWRPDPCRRP